jgi:hypothetical protein
VDSSAALLRDLLQLSSSAGLGDHELDAQLAALVTSLRAAVPTYRGMDMTVYDAHQPVRLTAFLDIDDGAITTSLRLPFAVFGADFHRDSRVVFYATTPGAFVDLAADLGHALQAWVIFDSSRFRATDWDDGDGHDPHHRDAPDPEHREGHGSIVLDADLPPRTLVRGLSGLEEMSTVNRAVGMLMDQGHHPDQAHDILCRQATAAGMEPHVFAARMLER